MQNCISILFAALVFGAMLWSGCQSCVTQSFLSSAGGFADNSVRIDQSSAAGTAWKFKPEGGEWEPILVPAGGWRAQGYTCDAGTYRTWIAVPKNVNGRRVKLTFDAINFGADIYAGKDAASLVAVAHHIDGWLPVTADLTALAGPGEKILVQVEVAGRKKFMVNGKYAVPEGATWYPGLEEGILRGVHLEMLPPVRVEDVCVRTHLAPDTLAAEVTLVNDSDNPAVVTLTASLQSASRSAFDYPAIPRATVSLAAHTRQQARLGEILWTIGQKSYWWPNVPYRSGYRAQLHALNLAVAIDGKTVQVLRQRFGFRQFQAVGNHYELNGVHCNLRGDNQQEANFGTDAYGIKKGFGPPMPDNPGWPQTVDNLQRLNFNVLRIHQIPPTSYMLDVCDERGLMLVEESPLRGSEGGEDYAAGKTNMLNMDRELVLRDRNHPSIILWSAANEWIDPIRDASAVIRSVDPTRVIIADGIGEMGADVINMEHYVSGISQLPMKGGAHRSDRPYGETEAVWANDNTPQGFAWMATSVRTRRLQGDADLRNYVLNNAWPNYVPGENRRTEILEKQVKHWGGGSYEMMPDIAEPWNNPNLQLIQQCYHPLAACDVEFDQANAISNARGEWPVVKPKLPPNSLVIRNIAVFNDEFSGSDITLAWELRRENLKGTILQHEKVELRIPPGEFRETGVYFNTPPAGEVALILKVRKENQERFVEDKIGLSIAADSPTSGRQIQAVGR
jgi:hypothetical protein